MLQILVGLESLFDVVIYSTVLIYNEGCFYFPFRLLKNALRESLHSLSAKIKKNVFIYV